MRIVRVAGLAALVGTPLAAQAFEGTIVTKMYVDGKPGRAMTSRFKGNKSRIEMEGGTGGGFMLMEAGKGVMITVMPAQKVYMTMDLTAGAEALGATKKPGERPAKPPQVTRTGKTETIAGYQCEHVLMKSENGQEADICVAKGLGYFGGSGLGAGGQRGGNAVPMEYRDLLVGFKDGFQPLKIEKIEGGKREVMLQVTSIERKSQAAADFEIPAGYKELNMSEMMKGRMPKMPVKPPQS